jgi:hypothetical protein
MGEITGNGYVDTHQSGAAADMNVKIDKFETDVPGIKASAYKQIGTDKYPVFDVDRETFHQNMEHGRKRVRFPEDSDAHKYLKGQTVNKKFYISYTDPTSKEVWTREIR